MRPSVIKSSCRSLLCWMISLIHLTSQNNLDLFTFSEKKKKKKARVSVLSRQVAAIQSLNFFLERIAEVCNRMCRTILAFLAIFLSYFLAIVIGFSGCNCRYTMIQNTTYVIFSCSLCVILQLAVYAALRAQSFCSSAMTVMLFDLSSELKQTLKAILTTQLIENAAKSEGPR